jgi:hypothetical protein
MHVNMLTVLCRQQTQGGNSWGLALNTKCLVISLELGRFHCFAYVRRVSKVSFILVSVFVFLSVKIHYAYKIRLL